MRVPTDFDFDSSLLCLYYHLRKFQKLFTRIIMFDSLPKDATQALAWEWSQYQAYFDALLAREINAQNIEAWLLDVTKVMCVLSEVTQRLDVAMSVNTADSAAEKLFLHFNEQIVPEWRKQ